MPTLKYLGVTFLAPRSFEWFEETGTQLQTARIYELPLSEI